LLGPNGESELLLLFGLRDLARGDFESAGVVAQRLSKAKTLELPHHLRWEISLSKRDRASAEACECDPVSQLLPWLTHRLLGVRTLSLRGDWNPVCDRFRELLRSEPASPRIFRELALCGLEYGQDPLARECFAKISNQFPENVYAQLGTQLLNWSGASTKTKRWLADLKKHEPMVNRLAGNWQNRFQDCGRLDLASRLEEMFSSDNTE
ncbi:MAG: hypothetical protein KDA84_15530, partial [Planctomycetaceae bacterium]|nr:hypothetical protein [Planctomycetaceae bacterium]